MNSHWTGQIREASSAGSQKWAARAVAEGRFKTQIVPVQVPSRKGPTLFEVDEHIRANVDIGQLAKMKPAFKKDGVVTPGNASGINDGAAAVVLASAEKVQALGLKPLARLIAYAHAGVDPAYMGMGPVPATKLTLQRAGLEVCRQLQPVHPRRQEVAARWLADYRSVSRGVYRIRRLVTRGRQSGVQPFVRVEEDRVIMPPLPFTD